VIRALEAIVEWSADNDLRHGYFAQVYLATTREVAVGLERGEFLNPERLEQLDVVFACRYLDALDAYLCGARHRGAWACSFTADRDHNLLVIQHILLGMNAHINLDLGISTAQIAPGPAIETMKVDFNRINALLARLIDRVEAALGSVNPLFAIGDRLIGGLDERAIEFSIEAARKYAWRCAQNLAASTDAADLERRIVVLDEEVCGFALYASNEVFNALVAPIRSLDRRCPREVIALLRTI